MNSILIDNYGDLRVYKSRRLKKETDTMGGQFKRSHDAEHAFPRLQKRDRKTAESTHTHPATKLQNTTTSMDRVNHGDTFHICYDACVLE